MVVVQALLELVDDVGCVVALVGAAAPEAGAAGLSMSSRKKGSENRTRWSDGWAQQTLQVRHERVVEGAQGLHMELDQLSS